MRLWFFTHAFCVHGLNLERFLNLLQKQQIPLASVRRKDARTLACQCCSADLAVITALAQERGWRITDVRPTGFSAVAARLRKRPGLLVGAALMLVLMFTASRFVWRVDVRQAGAYQADIVSFLEQSGYHTGMPRSRVDAKALESALLYRYPKAAWFHVHVRGMTLVVEVTHGVPPPEETGDEPAPVVASRDGIVQSVLVIAGTPEVKPGDVVRKGDVLIAAQERSSDGLLVPVRAAGTVMARAWESHTVSMPLWEITSTETGRETILTRLHTPWFSWPQTLDAPSYLASNTYLSEVPVVGAFFPVRFQTITLREVSMEYTPRPVEDVRFEAGEAALHQLKNALLGNDIIDKWVDYCMIEGDTLAACATAELLMDIGEYPSP